MLEISEKVLKTKFGVSKFTTSSKYNKRTAHIPCPSCGEIIKKDVSRMRAEFKRGIRHYFCDKSCKASFREASAASALKDYANTRLVPFVSSPLEKQTAGKRVEAGRSLLVGTAAEHLVCAHIINSGHNAFMSNQYCGYDLVADVDGVLYRVQVKATTVASDPTRKNSSRRSYMFHAGRTQYHEDSFDIMALVALDIGYVAYISMADYASRKTKSFQILPPNYRNADGNNSRSSYMNDFPLSKALAEADACGGKKRKPAKRKKTLH